LFLLHQPKIKRGTGNDLCPARKVTAAPRQRGACIRLRSDVGLYLIDDSRKCRLIGHCHVCQNLAVELDGGFLQTVHEHAVGQAMLTGGCIDTGNPQCAEYAFLVATITIGILTCTHDRLLGNAEYLAAAAAIAFGLLKNFLMTGPCCDPTFNSRHDYSLV